MTLETAAREWPSDWRIVRLDSIADLLSGGTPSKSRPEWWTGPIPWASPKDMKRFRLRDAEDHISAEGLEHGSRLAPAKSIFVVVRGMILAKDLPVAMAEVPMAFNQDMKAVVPREAVNPNYLLYALAARKDALATSISTSAHGTRRMGTSSLESLLLPLPPPEEQEAIGMVLSKLQMAVETQGRIVATLRELKAATMAKLFREGLRGEPLKQTDVGEIPASWKLVRFGDFATLQRGYDLPLQMRASGVVPVIGSNGIVGYHDKAMAKGPGVVTGRSGSIGASFHCDRDFWPLNTALFVVDFHGNHPRFVHHFFERFDFRRYAAGVSVPTLNRNLVHDAIVPVPSLEEQIQLAEIIENLDSAILDAESRRDMLTQLFSTTLGLLMSGQVRTTIWRVCADEKDLESAYPIGPGVPTEEFVAELARRFEPERVILFSERAEGSPRPFGEVGLLVEMDFAGLARDQAARIAQEIPHHFSLDLVVRRPGEVRRAIERGDRFIGGVVEKGKVLYTRPHGEARPPRVEATAKARPPRVLSEETLAEIVRRIVEAVQPEKIILFGSAARGEVGPDSDLDFLVVKSCANRREVAQTIYRNLRGIGFAKDVVVVTPEDIERDRDTIGYIIRPALREGRVVYAAA